MSDKIIAVSFSAYEKHGCVNCGCEYCYAGNFRGGGCTPVTCGECGNKFLILADGLNESRMGFGKEDGTFDYPKLQQHPRRGITKHKFILPDVKPEGEGEYFQPRGVGYDLAGFVKCKEAGERIVKMFEVLLRRPVKTWLDYREYEPAWIQVKVQEEDADLKKLNKLTQDGIITIDKIKECMITG